MARLAEEIACSLGDRTVFLRPSLQAALRLARDYSSFLPVFQAIGEGSVTVIGRVIGECRIESPALPDSLFVVPGRSLASRIVELQPVALDLVSGLLGLDPDKDHDREAKPADPKAKPVDLVAQYEEMAGFAMGILRWTPAETWNATPAEILAAATIRQKAFAPQASAKQDAKPHNELTLDQQARKWSANIVTRVVKADSAE